MDFAYAIGLLMVITLMLIGLREIWRCAKRSAHALFVSLGLTKPSLYDRLGGSFVIASLVDYFSEEILKSPMVGLNSPNPQLRAWSQSQSETRMPGLKFMRTLWVCDLAGGPQHYGGTRRGPHGRFDLSRAHANLKITSAQFDEVARILAASLDHFKVPAAEKAEVLGAFAAHKKEVVSA